MAELNEGLQSLLEAGRDYAEAAARGVFGLSRVTPYAFITSDGTGRITFANEAAAVLFGYGIDELVGANVDLIVPERFRASHEAGMERMARNEPSRLSGRTVEISTMEPQHAPPLQAVEPRTCRSVVGASNSESW